MTFGQGVLAGEDQWRAVVSRAQRDERTRLLLLLEPHLLRSTEGGRERLAAWEGRRAAGRPEIEDDPCTYGESWGIEIVRAAMALLPAPVRHSVLREAAFLFVGRECAAWTLSANFTDTDGDRRTRVVCCGPNADVPLVVHESVHVFSGPLPNSGSVAMTAAGGIGLLALASREGWRDRADRQIAQGEVLANALTIAWALAPGTCLPA